MQWAELVVDQLPSNMTPCYVHAAPSVELLLQLKPCYSCLCLHCPAVCVPPKCDDRACQAGLRTAGVCSYTQKPDGASCIDGPVPGTCRIGVSQCYCFHQL
jgi:hypothetical protein